jgi:hypothetical protein
MPNPAGPFTVDAFEGARYPMGEGVDYERYIVDTYRYTLTELVVHEPLPDVVSLQDALTDESWTPWYERMLNTEVSTNQSLFRHTQQQLFAEAAVASFRRFGEDAPLNAVLELAIADVFDANVNSRGLVHGAIQERRVVNFGDIAAVRDAFRQYFDIDIPDDTLTHDAFFTSACFDAMHGDKGHEQLRDAARTLSKRSFKRSFLPHVPIRFTREEVFASAEAMLQYLRRIEEMMTARHLTSLTSDDGAPSISALPTRGIPRARIVFGRRRPPAPEMTRTFTLDRFERSNELVRSLRLDYERFVIESYMSSGGHSMTPPPWTGIPYQPPAPAPRQRTIEEILADESWRDRFREHLNNEIRSATSDFSSTLQELFLNAALALIRRDGSDTLLSRELGITAEALLADAKPRTKVYEAIRERLALDFREPERVHTALHDYFGVDVVSDSAAHDVSFAFACVATLKDANALVTEELFAKAGKTPLRALKPSLVIGEPLQFTADEVNACRASMLEYLRRAEGLLA